MINKNVLAIVAVYDFEGVLDEATLYYIASLKKVVDRLIVTVNGKINADGIRCLERLVEDIFVRPNKGFDFGAWKDTIEGYIGKEEVLKYEEILLANDTCFGPFEAFENVFCQMRERDLEFWTLNYIEDTIVPYFESYFLVCKGRAIKELLKFFEEYVDVNATDIKSAWACEHALTERILRKKLKSGYYTSESSAPKNLSLYKSPDYVLQELGLPLIKKKAFDRKYFERNNCLNALYYIAKNSQYPLECILATIKRKYGVTFDESAWKQTYSSKMYFIPQNPISRQKIWEFCKQNSAIWVYGDGCMGTVFMAHMSDWVEDFKGFVLSDEFYAKKADGKNRVPLSEVINNEDGIIVALWAEGAKQVQPKLKNRKNVLYLSITN